jgi:kynurenine formamidase
VTLDTAFTEHEARALIEAMTPRVCNWGRWGAEDEIGTVNHITDERRRDAASLVRAGRVLSLALTFSRHGPQPPHERRLNPQHVMLDTGVDLAAGGQCGAPDGWGYSDDMVTMALQASTHWDSLAHVFYGERMYNDRDCRLVGAEGARRNSITEVRDRMAGRGVLLDIPTLHGIDVLPAAYEITTDDLERAFEQERIISKPGDVLFIRTGNLGHFRASGDWTGFTHGPEPGLSFDVLPWLHEQRVAAVASDTWAVEAIGIGPDPEAIHLPFHAIAIVQMGMMLGELFDLDALAHDCHRDGIYEFLFVAAPLPFERAVGAPVNPLAIK